MSPEENKQEEIEEQQPPDEQPLSAQDSGPEDEAVSNQEKGALSGDVPSGGEETPREPVGEAPSPSEEEQEPLPSLGEDLEAAEVPEISQAPGETAQMEPSAGGEEEAAEEAVETEQSPGELPVTAIAETEQEVGAAEEDVEKPAPGEVSGRGFRIPIPSRKATVSLAAGLLAGILVAGWLTAHRTRQLRDLAEIAESGGGLLTPLDKAKKLMEDKKYGSAQDLLQRFVNETAQSAERSEGLFLLAETTQVLEAEHPTESGYTEARETYRKAIEADSSSPRVPEALRNIAETYLAEEMYEEARTSLEEVVRKYPGLPDVAEVEFDIANTYLMQKDGSAAVRKLTSVIADYPDSEVVPRAKLRLARALGLDGQSDKAAKLYRDVLSAFPQDGLGAEARERLGDVASERGDYPEAVAHYQKRVEMPVTVEDNDRVLLKLARSRAATGDWKGCAATCRTMLELFDKSDLEPDVIIQLCRAEQEMGRVEAAIQYGYEGYTKFPENAALAKSLAELYSGKGDHAEAARLYDEAARLVPDDPQAWFGAALAHFEAGDLESSNRDFREVAKRFSSDALAYDAYLKLADILYLRGDPDRAIDLLGSRLHEHVVSTRRDPILSKIAGIYLDLGLPGQAAETYAKMLDGVDDDDVLARMGIACLKAQRWDTGLTALRAVDTSRLPQELAYGMYAEIGIALRSFGNLRGAIQNLESAVNVYPAHRDERGVTALLHTYLLANRVDEAKKLIDMIESWAAGDTTRSVMLARATLIWGDSLFSRGQYAAALKQFAKIAGQDDIPAQVREWAAYQKGNSHFELSRYSESVAAYQQFLDSYPSSSWKKAAQTRLDLAKLEAKLHDRNLR